MGRRGGAAERAPWTLRAVLLLVALGVVLMHHVAGAHQHAPAAPPAPIPAAVEHAAPPAQGPAAALHVHHDAPDDDPAGTLHDCLAVLAAVAAALAVAVALLGSRRPAGPRPGGTPPSVRLGEVPAPPTPVPLRLAQLQVLRR